MHTVRRAFALFVLVAAGCTEPHYESGNLQCGPQGECPSGFVCDVNNLCRDPSVQLPPPDLSVQEDLAMVDMAQPVDLAKPLPECKTIVCDDFETGVLSSQWTPYPTHGQITVDSGHVHKGLFALHVHSDFVPDRATDSDVSVYTNRGFPLVTTLYARAWVYFQSPYPSDFNQVLNLVDAAGGGAAYCVQNQLAVFNGYTNPTSWGQEDLYPITTDRWTCLQMRYDQGAPMGTAVLSIDGTDYITVDTVATNQMVGMYFGAWFFNHSGALPASDMWYDDIAIDDKPIPCE
jgi:hypothetical protein